MTFDSELRPLASKLKARTRLTGPISVEQYMQACLHDPEHGYYVTRPAIGAGGDFITAPEISQVFGELIGLWCAVVWQQMGKPARVRLAELGPGRGTLMRDALRAARVVPEFLAALTVELIETNEALVGVQRQTLHGGAVPVEWRRGLAAASDALPSIVLANEFLDTLPVTQHIRKDNGWVERGVNIDGNSDLVFAHLPA